MEEARARFEVVGDAELFDGAPFMGVYVDQGGQLAVKEDTQDMFIYYSQEKQQWIVGNDPTSGEGWIYCACPAPEPDLVDLDWNYWDPPSNSWQTGGNLRIVRISGPPPAVAMPPPADGGARQQQHPQEGQGETKVAEDPLDAFMADIANVVKEQKERRKKELEDRYEAEATREAEDDALAEAKSKAFVVTKTTELDENGEEQLYDHYGNPIGKDLTKVESLAALDHTKIKYKSFKKNFFKPHDDIKNYTGEQMRQFYEANQIQLSGGKTPRPCLEFHLMSLPKRIYRNLEKQGFEAPTPIQACAIPCILSGRDMLGMAKTGSGKTVAFTIPMLVHVKAQPPLGPEDGPIALTLGPTRELAHQIFLEVKKFAKGMGITVVPCFGGMNKHEQVRALGAGCEIVVGTPGRMIDVIKADATNLQRVTYLVLDEADKMFKMGFEPQVRSITGQIRPDRQTLLFSATFPPRVESLARDILVSPVRISVGTVGAANKDIRQVVDVLKPSEKWSWLSTKIQGFLNTGQVLVFAGTKAATEELSLKLAGLGCKVGCIHGNKTQHQRMDVLHKFKTKKFQILVATDVASRGIDIRGLKTVINYDMARDIDSHVHRVGRTGRAGENGIAYTLFTMVDERMAGALARSLEMANQPVPAQLTQIASANGTLKPAWSGGGGRGKRKLHTGGGLGMKGAGYSNVTTAAMAAAGKRVSKFVKEAVKDDKKKSLFGGLIDMARIGNRAQHNAKRQKNKNMRRINDDNSNPINFIEKAHSLAQQRSGSIRTQTIRAQFASSFCEAANNDLEEQFNGPQTAIIVEGKKKNPPKTTAPPMPRGFHDGPLGASGASAAIPRGFHDGPSGQRRQRKRRGFSDVPPPDSINTSTTTASVASTVSTSAPINTAQQGMHPERMMMLGLQHEGNDDNRGQNVISSSNSNGANNTSANANAANIAGNNNSSAIPGSSGRRKKRSRWDQSA